MYISGDTVVSTKAFLICVVEGEDDDYVLGT